MFLTLSDFNARPYRIPNQQESPDLQPFIDDREEEILLCLLGYEMHAEFVANVDTSDVEQKWIDLRDGKTYTYSGNLYKYAGIVDMLRPAVYAEWIDSGAYKLTNVGYIQNNAPKESQVLDHEVFKVEAWNRYIKKAYDCGSQRNTWYGFMKANESNYPEWEFRAEADCLQYRNRWSL